MHRMKKCINYAIKLLCMILKHLRLDFIERFLTFDAGIQTPLPEDEKHVETLEYHIII